MEKQNDVRIPEFVIKEIYERKMGKTSELLLGKLEQAMIDEDVDTVMTIKAQLDRIETLRSNVMFKGSLDINDYYKIIKADNLDVVQPDLPERPNRKRFRNQPGGVHEIDWEGMGGTRNVDKGPGSDQYMDVGSSPSGVFSSLKKKAEPLVPSRRHESITPIERHENPVTSTPKMTQQTEDFLKHYFNNEMFQTKMFGNTREEQMQNAFGHLIDLNCSEEQKCNTEYMQLFLDTCKEITGVNLTMPKRLLSSPKIGLIKMKIKKAEDVPTEPSPVDGGMFDPRNFKDPLNERFVKGFYPTFIEILKIDMPNATEEELVNEGFGQLLRMIPREKITDKEYLNKVLELSKKVTGVDLKLPQEMQSSINRINEEQELKEQSEHEEKEVKEQEELKNKQVEREGLPLEEQLIDAIKTEDYEKAREIQNKIDRIKKMTARRVEWFKKHGRTQPMPNWRKTKTWRERRDDDKPIMRPIEQNMPGDVSFDGGRDPQQEGETSESWKEFNNMQER